MNDEQETAFGPDTEQTDAVRKQSFDAEGPLELDLSNGSGRIEVQLTDRSGVDVEVRHDPSATNPLAQGINSLISWFSDQFGGQFPRGNADFLPIEAVHQTRIELTGQRLVVRPPKSHGFRHVPLHITVHAPSGSRVDARSGSGDVAVTGSAGRVDIQSGSGDIAVDHAVGRVTVRTGSGSVRLGPMLAALQVRSGTGEIEVSSIADVASLGTGSGDVRLGAVQGEVMVRTGSGDVTVADAVAGSIDLFTGSGEIRVGVRPGTAALVDLVSGSGQAHSELDLLDSQPTGEAKVRIRGRTGSGNAVVAAAAG